jgi:hypothetical protein
MRAIGAAEGATTRPGQSMASVLLDAGVVLDPDAMPWDRGDAVRRLDTQARDMRGWAEVCDALRAYDGPEHAQPKIDAIRDALERDARYLCAALACSRVSVGGIA